MEALDTTDVDIALEQLHISTEHENLTASALERTVGPMLEEDRLQSVLDASADENAALAVDVELTGDAFEPERFLFAPENGEWRIVAFG